jgi:beta-lactamase class A
MKWWLYILLAITTPLSFLYLTHLYDQQTYAGAPLTTASKCPFTYINKQRCEPDLAPKKKEFVQLRNDLTSLIENEKKAGRLTEGAVYFRDLQNGPVISINSQDFFIPASLLKLPLMITYYKKAEADPEMLKKKIEVTKDIQSLEQNITPSSGAQIGKTYTREELLDKLITQSDNIAWKALLKDLRADYSEEDFIGTLGDLGIIDPRKRTDQQYITVQNYASLFRILYNSSYLNIEMSDKALEVLTRSEFKDGLYVGVPNNVKIAHKFGEQKNGDEQQLHDCGVVYYPPNPYVLCVMTRGTNIPDLERVVQTVSKEVYMEVESRNAD